MATKKTDINFEKAKNKLPQEAKGRDHLVPWHDSNDIVEFVNNIKDIIYTEIFNHSIAVRTREEQESREEKKKIYQDALCFLISILNFSKFGKIEGGFRRMGIMMFSKTSDFKVEEDGNIYTSTQSIDKYSPTDAHIYKTEGEGDIFKIVNSKCNILIMNEVNFHFECVYPKKGEEKEEEEEEEEGKIKEYTTSIPIACP